jgi:hypothetical protein
MPAAIQELQGNISTVGDVFSPKCGEGKLSELRVYGFLRSSLLAGDVQ